MEKSPPMSKIVLYSMGYRGDVFPYVPVASALAKRGHDVTFVVPREFHPVFEAEGFRCVHSGTDFGPAALDQHAAYAARWGMRLGGSMLARLYFGEFMIPHLDALYEAIDAEVADADVLVSHPVTALVGAMSAERRGVPWISADLFPMLLPSADVPPPGMPNVGPPMNRALWRLLRSRTADRVGGGGAFRDLRQRLGLSNDGWGMLDGRLSPHANIGLVSPAYFPPQRDWPEPFELVGFTPWAGPNHGELTAEVRSFLDDGEAPILVTLGTSAASARSDLFARAATQLDRIGARSIFLTSTASLAEQLSASIGGGSHLVMPFAPIEPLLPHCRAIVHSGAHGTNSLALLAGKPSAVAPALFDQLWHAKRQEQLGTGVWVRSHDALGAAVERLATDTELAATAAAFGERLAVEDGITTACNRIEQLCPVPSRPSARDVIDLRELREAPFEQPNAATRSTR